MDIYYSSTKLKKVCNQQKEAVKKFGEEIAKKLGQRLFELHAADTLTDISHLPPPRLHSLNNDRDGQFAVDLKHPFRLIFEPYDYPSSEEVDKTKVVAIKILEVGDYHG